MENDLKVHYLKHVVPAMMKSRAYMNGHQVPKLEKIVLNCSVGSVTDIKVALEDAVHDLTAITGQKPIKTRSKKSISNFNLRLNQEIGCKVTLRGKIMYDFLLRFIRAALPRIRDFRGIEATQFDAYGNFNLGTATGMIWENGVCKYMNNLLAVQI
jgi:large subunit ribosomal protein L5